MVSPPKPRPTGAVATLDPRGEPRLVTVTGGSMGVVTRPSQEGFSPLDLLYSALASCLALSLRMAAGEAGCLDRLGQVRVDVAGEKAQDAPARIEHFTASIEITGPMEEDLRDRLIRRAEELCTVSNTLHGAATISVRPA